MYYRLNLKLTVQLSQSIIKNFENLSIKMMHSKGAVNADEGRNAAYLLESKVRKVPPSPSIPHFQIRLWNTAFLINELLQRYEYCIISEQAGLLLAAPILYAQQTNVIFSFNQRRDIQPKSR